MFLIDCQNSAFRWNISVFYWPCAFAFSSHVMIFSWDSIGKEAKQNERITIYGTNLICILHCNSRKYCATKFKSIIIALYLITASIQQTKKWHILPLYQESNYHQSEQNHHLPVIVALCSHLNQSWSKRMNACQIPCSIMMLMMLKFFSCLLYIQQGNQLLYFGFQCKK